MRIVFDAFWWRSGPPSLRHVLRETVLQWAESFPDDELVMVVRHRDLADVIDDVPPGATLIGTRLWPQALAAAVGCALARRSARADVTLVHNFAAAGRGSVVFLHDVLFLTNPEWFTAVERLYFGFMAVLARRAAMVLTSSATEAARIATRTQSKNVVPVGIGMSNELRTTAPVRPPGALEPGSFLLTLGRLNIRKNLATSIEAALRSGVLSPRFPLVVVGAADGRIEALPAGAAEAVSDGRIVLAGHVEDAELVWLYRNTSLFLFMTRGEGFGMPVVEAAYFGAPMVISDIEVLAEIAPRAAVRVQPEDVAAIASAIRDAPRGDVAAPRRVVPAVASEHSWERTVQAMRSAITSHTDRALRRADV